MTYFLFTQPVRVDHEHVNQLLIVTLQLWLPFQKTHYIFFFLPKLLLLIYLDPIPTHPMTLLFCIHELTDAQS